MNQDLENASREQLLAAVKGLLYVADNKAADNQIGRWWAGVIRGAIQSALKDQP